MKLRIQVRQALHCCVLIAEASGTPLTASGLAETCGLPKEYLSKTLQALARAGVVTARYGPGGGYKLGRLASEITVLDIVEAIEGPIDSLRFNHVFRSSDSERNRNTMLVVSQIVEIADAAWQGVLAKATVAEIVRKVEVHDA